MMERIRILVAGGEMAGPMVRYDVLARLREASEKQGVTVLAFGFGDDDIRLVVDGTRDGVANLCRALKVGTASRAAAWGLDLGFAPPERRAVLAGELEVAVAWAHRAPVDAGRVEDPLESPWSSHRDLLGYRVAPFFDAAVVEDRVDAELVHKFAGGRRRPRGFAGARARREPLPTLLRVAAAVTGVMPSDRRCFRLFVHLGRARGWQSRHLADTLAVTTRRVRQLSVGREPLVPTALRYLACSTLLNVP